MGKKKKLGFTSLIFRLGDTTPATTTTTTTPSSSSWAWPSCKQQPRTDSFRGGRGAAADESVYKTVNSVYFDSTDSFFTHSSEDNNSESSAMSLDANANANDDSAESLIRGLVRSSADRLFVEPGGDTSSILGEAKGGGGSRGTSNPFKESVAMAMESHDPYVDFKKSMEEMVAAHGMRDWECLEELLVWYLRVNGKKTHGYIVGAFVDLLVGLAADARGDEEEEEEEESGDLLCSSHYCGSSSLSLSSSRRNCYEIEEVEEGSGSC